MHDLLGILPIVSIPCTHGINVPFPDRACASGPSNSPRACLFTAAVQARAQSLQASPHGFINRISR